MTWNNTLAPPAISSGASLGASGHHPLWLYAARCAWWQQGPADSFLSRPLTCGLAMLPPGKRCVTPSTIGARAAAVNCASVVTRRPIWPRWSNASSDQVCHPRKKWIKKKYFQSIGEQNWVFFVEILGQNG